LRSTLKVANLSTIVAKFATVVIMDNIPPILKYLFSSKLRVKILSHFFFHPGESFYIRQLASVLREPAGTVARELSHLEEAGMLKHERIGKQKHYSIFGACPISEDLRNIFLKTAGASAELKTTLEKSSSVELAFIYGSYASGEANVRSDIDLMIIGDASDRELAPLIARIERRLKREINYVVYARQEAEKRLRKSGDFIHEVFRGQKILLVGDSNDRLLRAG